MQNMKILGLILARKGSKGLKNKNLKVINGFSLVELAILAALESKVITEIIFSTDYKKSEVGNLAARYYVKRPKHLSKDKTLSYDVIEYLLNELKNKNYYPDYIILVEPPCPFRNGKLIDEVFKLNIRMKSDSMVTCKEVKDAHPIRIKKIDKNLNLKGYCLEEPAFGLPRQLQNPAYLRDQAVYVLKAKNFENKKFGIYGKKRHGFLNKSLTVNIDYPLDYELAKTIFKNKTFKILFPNTKPSKFKRTIL